LTGFGGELIINDMEKIILYILKVKKIRVGIKKSDGFSLIEMISVILILGIVAGAVMPMFNTTATSVSLAAATIETDLRFVQELAMARNPESGTQAIGIVFTPGLTSYTITDPAGMFSKTRELPQGVSIIPPPPPPPPFPPPPPPNNKVAFNKYGEPEIGTTNVSFNIGGGGKTARITVELYTGRVTYIIL